jgi:hypothetical protein
VLVKWTMDRPFDRRFLPRLPAPICHLSVGPDNRYLAISTSDNGEFGCVTCFLTAPCVVPKSQCNLHAETAH